MSAMWPSRIARTIIWEIFSIFLVTLVSLTTLMMFIGVAREAIKQGLAPMTVVALLPYALPNALVFAIPGTILFSVCCVYGRMAADKEIFTIQSMGIPPSVIIRPALIIAFLMSLVTVWLVDLAFTWGHSGVQQVILRSVEQVSYSVLKRNLSYQNGLFTISVLGVEGNRLIQPKISLSRSNKTSVRIEAAESRLSVAKDGRSLLLSLTNGEVDLGDGTTFKFPDTFEYTVSLAPEESTDLLYANPSHMPLAEIGPAQIKQIADIRRKESAIAVQTGFSLLMGRFDEITDDLAYSRLADLERSRGRLNRLGTETARRWATGFSCFAFAMVGIPMAILLKTSDYMTTFGICFLPILIVYYPLFALSLDLAKDGVMPPIFVWLANSVTFSSSLVLMRKALYS
jgi:lipopolysaccharide export system permease protein